MMNMDARLEDLATRIAALIADMTAENAAVINPDVGFDWLVSIARLRISEGMLSDGFEIPDDIDLLAGHWLVGFLAGYEKGMIRYRNSANSKENTR